MFESNEIVDAKVERLWEACKSLKEGDVLTHEMIDPILDCERNNGHWKTCMGRLYGRLEKERGIVTMFLKTVGLQFLNPEEVVTVYPAYRTKKSMSQNRKLRKSLRLVNMKKLNPFQRRLHLFQSEMARNTQRELRRTLKEQQQVIRPSPTLPRRKPIKATARA